jgi:hypothetical protein
VYFVYFKEYNWVYYNLQILQFILHMYSSFVISINGLNIIFTLNIYFEYIKFLHKIFPKYIVPISQLHPSYFIILFKIITKDIYKYLYHIILHIFINYMY